MGSELTTPYKAVTPAGKYRWHILPDPRKEGKMDEKIQDFEIKGLEFEREHLSKLLIEARMKIVELEIENRRLSELLQLSEERDEAIRKDLVWNIERIKELEGTATSFHEDTRDFYDLWQKSEARIKELEEGIAEIYSTMNQYPMATYSLRITIQKVFKLAEKKKDG